MATIPNYGKLTNANNAMMMDAIRNGASMDYQRRVPSATQAGVDSAARKIMEYAPLRNEFIDALVNRIGMMFGRSQVFSNPLKEFKKGIMDYGDTVEEYQVGLVKAHTYSSDYDFGEKALFGQEKAEVQSNFHTVNREEFYKITVNEMVLRRAFLNDGGLSGFVSDLMQAPLNSDEFDEFLIMCKLFKSYESYGGFFHVQVPDITDIESTEADAKQALRIIRAMGETLKFPSTRYNAAKMPSFANADDLVFFLTPQARATVDVMALAAAFNIDRADVPFRMVTVRPEDLGIDGAQAILTHKDFFQVYDTVLENRQQPNAAGMYTNFFWHHHGIYSTSRFVPSVLFTTKPGDDVIEVRDIVVSIDTITVKDVDGNTVAGAVAPGSWYEVEAGITTDPAVSTANHGVTWALEGALSPRTVITQKGVLKISGTETAASIKIVAYDANSNTRIGEISKDVTKTVTGDTHPEWPIDHTGDGVG